MNTGFTDEQNLLRRLASRIAGDFRADPQRLMDQRADSKSWTTIGKVGLIGMRLPEAAGGYDATAVDAALTAEMLAAGPAVVPFLGPTLAAEFVNLAAVDSANVDLITRGLTTTIALDPAGGDKPTLASDFDGAIAWDSAGSTRALAALDEGEGHRLVAVTTNSDDLPTADLTRRISSLKSSADVELLGWLSAEGLARWQAFALTLLSADLAGAMRGALDLGVAYALEREQFGRAIGSFQALQQLLADAYVSTRAAFNATMYAAWKVDSGSPHDALLSARVAKAYTARTAFFVAEAAMQIHGGMGITWDNLSHLYLRRVAASVAILGNEDHQLSHIAQVRLGD